MTLSYKCLIEQTFKELPDINSLAQNYSKADRDVLEFYLHIAKEILESAQTKVGRLLFDIHCRFAELNTYKLEFQVGTTFSNSSEFKIQREVKATNLKEALDFAEITVKRLGEDSGITLEKIYSHRDLVLWDCKAKESYLWDMTNSKEEEEQPEEFKLKFEVINSEGKSSIFFKTFSAESENLAIEEGLDIEKRLTTLEVKWILNSVEGSDGRTVWIKHEKPQN